MIHLSCSGKPVQQYCGCVCDVCCGVQQQAQGLVAFRGVYYPIVMLRETWVCVAM